MTREIVPETDEQGGLRMKNNLRDKVRQAFKRLADVAKIVATLFILIICPSED